MCGIYGMVGADADQVLARMGAALVHRGPDADGTAQRGLAALGCRRLAIVDVAHGAQPVADESGDVIAVCNGEIYNHAALRAELASRGHNFRSGSDAEVLPHLYEELGVELAGALEGMFALALWDSRRGRLLLARDRLGEKPLYHATVPQGLLFASEPKALLATALVPPDPDWTALGAYLHTGYVPNPASAFTTIRKLPPGGCLVLDGEARRSERYWDVRPLLEAPALNLDLETAAAELRAHIERAVTAALLGDDPVGVFLSGGLDSTTIAATARARGGDV